MMSLVLPEKYSTHSQKQILKLSVESKFDTKKESKATLFIASLKNQTEEIEFFKVLDNQADLQIAFNQASLEELSELVKIIVDSKLSESFKQKFLKIYTFTDTDNSEKNLIFRSVVLSSDLDEFTKAKLLSDSGITICTSTAPYPSERKIMFLTIG